ncbi:MAG: PQQ-binding-like beta-propeller repeat protein, partial [Candidatus Bathyarchaeota archaeon]|nr:PQQ-binding-like beta-propeller repeat protein [Candidatus Termiticorpusculum sp.]
QITDPNGKATNYTGKTWSTGTVGRKMSFSEPGNYTLQTLYDGEYYAYGTNNNRVYRYMKPAESEPITLQIIEGYWKPDYPGHNLPTEYWTRPVDSQLREWYTIMGSWLYSRTDYIQVTQNAPYNDAPESAHILWSKDIGDVNGGLAGGDSGTSPFQAGDAYEGRFNNAVIVAGVLYYNREFSGGSSAPNRSQMVIAVDLHTGKILWERNFDGLGNARISHAQILTFISENNRGSWSYLWIGTSGNMYAIEPKTGELRYNMTGVPAGQFFYGPSGEMLKYSITGNATAGFRLLQWNSTYTATRTTEGTGANDRWGTQVNSRASNGDVRSFNATMGYDINVSISGLTASAGSLVAAFPGDRVIFSTTPNATGFTLTGISINEENTGYMLFNRQFQAPQEWEGFVYDATTYQTGWATFSQEDMIGIFWTRENRVNYAFSLESGKLLWQTETRIYADAWAAREGIIVDGKFITSSVGGIVHCYDVTNGEEIWTYANADKYNESYHGENWWSVICFVSDGKVYLGHFVHSPTIPLTRGAPFFALDIETGNPVWEIDGAFRQSQWGQRAIIGDSIIATQDYYDSKIYAVGKGPSEMTASISNPIATAGTPVMISGTVIDISPGTTSDDAQLRFPKGVPAVSDESQSEWMLHVYKHFESPKITEGVEVTVYAQQEGRDPVTIGTTTSNANGRYSINWVPPADAIGDWDVYAYFSGSASYYGTYAQTELSVYATAVEPIPLEQSPPYGWYIAGAAIAIIIVLIVGILVILRKIDKKQ